MRSARLIILALPALLACAWAAPQQRVVAFLPFWSQYRPNGCATEPKDFPAHLATHALFAFVFLNPDLSPKPLDYRDTQLFAQMRRLKAANPALKIMVSIGGAGMNEAGSAYKHLFSQAVATKTNRTRFITAAMAFCSKYGFDGVDLDWEYPGIPVLGGRPSDKPGLAAVVREWRSAIRASGKPFIISIDTPQFCYGTGAADDPCSAYDFPNIWPHVDFISPMTYGYHDPGWDPTTYFHTNWASDAQYAWGLRKTFDFYTKVAKVPPRKLNLGLAFYGVSWRLANPQRNGLHAPSAGPGTNGACTPGEPIGWRDLRDMYDRGAKLVEDVTKARAAYITQGNQWVAFDTPRTLVAKLQAAKAEYGLGGCMIWEASYDDPEHTLMAAVKTWKAAPLVRRPPKPVPFCGGGFVGNKTCANPVHCCSGAGWCWNDFDHCRPENCVGGPCQGKPNNGTCGGGSVGNKLCRDATHCCSVAGWCWNDADHCRKANCVGGPCWTT